MKKSLQVFTQNEGVTLSKDQMKKLFEMIPKDQSTWLFDLHKTVTPNGDITIKITKK